MQKLHPQVSRRTANDKPTKRSLHALAFVGGIFWGLTLLGACQPTPAMPRAEQMPEREFILQTLSFQERRDGHVLWRGQAKRSAGDLTTSQVDGLDLVRMPQTPSEVSLHICAEHAQLALERGQAHFCPVLAYDDSGRHLVGQSADYDEATQTLHAHGPILVTAPNIRLEAQTAHLSIDTGVLMLDGPITGRLNPGASGPPK